MPPRGHPAAVLLCAVLPDRGRNGLRQMMAALCKLSATAVRPKRPLLQLPRRSRIRQRRSVVPSSTLPKSPSAKFISCAIGHTPCINRVPVLYLLTRRGPGKKEGTPPFDPVLIGTVYSSRWTLAVQFVCELPAMTWPSRNPLTLQSHMRHTTSVTLFSLRHLANHLRSSRFCCHESVREQSVQPGQPFHQCGRRCV